MILCSQKEGILLEVLGCFSPVALSSRCLLSCFWRNFFQGSREGEGTVVLAVSIKKESATLNAPGLTGDPLSVTDSAISIALPLNLARCFFMVERFSWLPE